MGFNVFTSTGALKNAASMFTLITNSATGSQNNLNLGITRDSLVEWSGGADMTLTGVAGGTAGRCLIIKNTTSGFVISVSHVSGSSSAGNQFHNFVTSGPTPIAARGCAIYVHDGTYWRLIAHEQGAWIQRTFSAGNFAATAPMTWTVDSGDVIADRYRISGNTLSYEFSLQTTTFSGTASPSLTIAVPGAYSPATTVLGTAAVTRNPTSLEACYMNVTSGSGTMNFIKVAETNFTLGTNNTSMFGSFSFDVT